MSILGFMRFIICSIAGIAFIALAACVIADVSLPFGEHAFSEDFDVDYSGSNATDTVKSTNKDTLKAQFIGFAKNSGFTHDTADGSHIVLELLDPQTFSYVELNISEISKKAPMNTRIHYSKDGVAFAPDNFVDEEMKVGRNFISLPKGEYKALHIYLEGDLTLVLNMISLHAKMPVRWRFIAAFAAFSVLWICASHSLSRTGTFGRGQLALLGKYSYLLINLVKRDFSLKYRRSFLGVLWSMLSPLAMMAIITAVFSNIFRIQVENFPTYYMAGSVVFSFVAEATSGALGSVPGASGLIKKVYIPKYIFPVEKCLFALVNFMFSFAATLVMMCVLKTYPTAAALLFFVPLAYAFVFAVGVGLALSAVNVFFRDIGHLWGIWTSAWLYLTPIMYPMGILPKGLQRGIATLNPMYSFVACFRDLVAYGKLPGLRTNAICIAWSLGALLAGLLVFKKQQDKFILHI
jgi:ABC-2 type transport system permease protein